MHHFLRAFAASLLATLALTSGATAADAARVPADAQVVAGPTASGERLLAWMRSGQVCTVLAAREDAEGPFTTGDDCGPAPALVPLGHETIDSGEEPAVAYGFAGVDVAAVRLATHDGRTVADAPVTAGTGALAGLRFFLVEASATHPPPTELHVLDATGTVRRAESIGFMTDHDPLAIGRPRRVAAGGRGDGRWHLVLRREWRLAPTPLEPTRHEVTSCVTIVRPHDRSSVCNGGATQERPIMLGTTRGCDGMGTLLPMLVRDAVRRVTVLRTDGRRMNARLVQVDGVDGWRVGFVRVPGAFGVRRIDVVDGSGRRVASIDMKAAPPSAECADRRDLGVSTADVTFFADAGGADAIGGPGDVVAADRADELCVALGTAERCGLPPVEPMDAWAVRGGRDGAPTVLAVVPPDIARVVARTDDGQRTETTPVALPADYTGRYRDVVRLVRVDLPAGRTTSRLDLRDATGRLVGIVVGPDQPEPSAIATLLPASAGPSLNAGVYDFRVFGEAFGFARRFGCLAAGPVSDETCAAVTIRHFLVTVSCAPRRTLIIGLTPRPSDRLTLRTAGGATIAGRIVALPRRLRETFRVPGKLGGGATLLVAPAGAAPRRLVLDEGGQRHSVALPLPPASAQCGYRHVVDLTLEKR